MVCIAAKCQKPAVSCTPECKENEICSEKGTCEVIQSESCDNCLAGETCVKGACLCGSKSCKDNEICKNNKCELKDPCEGKTCQTGQVCVDGTCKTAKVSLNDGKTSLDVYLSSKRIVTATKSTTKKLTWTLDGIAADKELSSIICMTSDKKISKTIKPCIVYDDKNKTEKVTFIGLSRKPKTKVVKVVDAQKNSAQMTLNLKPYFGMDYFVKLSSTYLIYKNGITPGPFMTLEQYAAVKDSDNIKANLCGNKNSFCRTSFNEDETAVFDADMYSKYIRPKMLKHNNEYYGTRASVVAAARFLILQFPYDIPYAQGGAQHVEQGRGHYIWAYWSQNNENTKTKLSEAQVFGLNLTKNDYNASLTRTIIRNTAIPWGAWDDSIPYETLSDDKKKTRNGTYKFNGMECSGFVAWALKNGRLNLGDWTTNMFAYNGSCVIDGKIKRNFRCKTHVNQEMNKIPKERKSTVIDGKTVSLWYGSCSNSHNKLTSAYEKLNKLKDTDFVQLNCKCKSKSDCSNCEPDIQKIFNKAKAGDLLWKGGYINKDKTLYNNGHIAMIIGLKRDKNNNVTDIEVGEAVTSSGNKLRQWTISTFAKDSVWVNTTSNATFLIKMDNVYNYYSDKYNITTKSEKSDCPNNVKSGGNCYNYSEMYNEEFNKAIISKELPPRGDVAHD